MDIDGSAVHALFIKPAKSAQMVDVSPAGMNVRAGHGIDGDCNAHPLSPRQVLITRCEDLQHFGVQPGNLRENIVLRGVPREAFVPGMVLGLGRQVSVRLTFHCEPCKRIAHVVRSLDEIAGRRGLVGVVVSGGRLEIGNSVAISPRRQPALSEVPYERFLLFLGAVPRGKVVDYKQVVIGMGVADSYVRAIPRYLRRSREEQLPIHRVVDSGGSLIPAHVPHQLEALQSEGVEVTRAEELFGGGQFRVDLQRFSWRGNSRASWLAMAP